MLKLVRKISLKRGPHCDRYRGPSENGLNSVHCTGKWDFIAKEWGQGLGVQSVEKLQRERGLLVDPEDWPRGSHITREMREHKEPNQTWRKGCPC